MKAVELWGEIYFIFWIACSSSHSQAPHLGNELPDWGSE